MNLLTTSEANCSRFNDKLYSGEHEAIITQEVWESTQKLLKENSPYEGSPSGARRIMPFQRIVRCGYCGGAMKAAYTQKSRNKTYRYLICEADSKRINSTCPLQRVPLNELEKIVIEDIHIMLSKPEIVFGILSEAKELDPNGCNLTEEQIRNSFSNLSAVWDVMYPVEKYKLIQTIISNITVFRDRIKIEYNKEALSGLVHEQKGKTV